ncbi:MAG: amino acid permease [Bacteroidetes bacterium]|nr:MAG: amino acid permease [Bacteroidota bacterium]
MQDSGKAALKQTLGLQFVLVFVIANILGSGVYKKVAPMADALHSSGWVLIAWVIGGIISLFGALSYAEVAGLLADTGGDYSYYKKIYNKFFAFQFGWSTFTIIQTAAISSLAYVFAQSLHNIAHFPPVLESSSNFNIAGIFYPFRDFNVKLTAICLILLLTWVNTQGLKTGAWLGTVILLLVFAGLFTIIFFGLTSKESNLSMAFSLDTTNNQPVTFSAMFTAMLAAFWGYQGWASVGYIGGEAKNANRNIPRGIAIGVFIVIALYLLVNTAYLSLLPITSLEQIKTSSSGIAAVEAVKVFWGRGGELFISVLILITTFGCTHATIISSCRIYYAMTKEKMFFKPVAELNKHAVPHNSLFYQCVWASILVLSGTFDQLTDMIIFAVFVFYGATAFGVFVLRKKMPDAHRPYKVWGYPIVPAIVIIISAALFVNTIITQPREAGIGLALMATGIPMWYWFNRKKD